LKIVLCLLTTNFNNQPILSPQTICNLVDLFGVDCRTLPVSQGGSENCSKSKDSDDGNDASLKGDVICFIVLLIQRRIFMSHFFQHAVNEYKAQSTLAARFLISFNF
jgi:hypothetical protein